MKEHIYLMILKISPIHNLFLLIYIAAFSLFASSSLAQDKPVTVRLHKVKIDYRDPKVVSENGNRLWWSKDTAKHSGASQGKSPSTWKVFEQTKDGLKHYKDADKYGQFIKDKHKGPVGKLVEWKDLRGVHDPKIFKGK